MPHLRIDTNLPSSKVPKELPHELCKIVAETLNKPLEVCVVTINSGQTMSFGGVDEPCAQATLMFMADNKLAPEKYKLPSKAISEKVHTVLGIPPSKMYIHFQDAKPFEIGVHGTTMHDFV